MSETANKHRLTRCFDQSDAYRAEIHDLIPGGAHTYSRGDDQFPARSPAAIARGKGGRVWDIDGNEYVDCGMALGSVNLGHAYEPVLAAVRAQLDMGAAFTRPAAIERDYARAFIEAVPGVERVKFAKNGSTVTTAAVKLARAHTGRDLVAFPRNQPFFSYDDWFVGQTLCNSGVPESVRALSLTYDSTRPETLRQLFTDYPNQIACVITEPEEVIPQPPEKIQEVARITREGGAVFILDEMVTGFRSGFPGAATRLEIEPDLSTWGKGMANGFSVCALAGRAEIMDLGGIRQPEEPRVFLISTTHGGESHALAAALRVLEICKSEDVIGKQRQLVKSVATGMGAIVKSAGLENGLEIHASPWRVICICKDAYGQVSQGYRTLMIQEMIAAGALFPGYFLPCYTHTPDDISDVLSAFEDACDSYGKALASGLDTVLVGEASQPVFRKYNGCTQMCPETPCPLEDGCRPR
jgi:glutamate-1-semialdehyde 2,1-aminomutase